jgi:16S rRNA (uracil1498-N3)-methyltransferase
MTSSRFHHPQLAAGPAEIAGPEAHHALHVIRVRVGDAVELFDGLGRVAAARVTGLSRAAVHVDCEAPRSNPRPLPTVHLLTAIPKGNRVDWLLEKATELAAASLTPVVFERSVGGAGELGHAKRERWLGHCIAAAKQCGLDHLPELREPAPLPQALACATGTRLVGDPAGGPIAAALAQAQADVWLLIGPEGGLTDAERVLAAQTGFAPVRLGSTILRIETAAVSLLAAVRAILP